MHNLTYLSLIIMHTYEVDNKFVLIRLIDKGKLNDQSIKNIIG